MNSEIPRTREVAPEICYVSLEESAKGTWQAKVSITSGSVERSEELLGKAIDSVRKVAKERKIALTGAW